MKLGTRDCPKTAGDRGDCLVNPRHVYPLKTQKKIHSVQNFKAKTKMIKYQGKNKGLFVQ